MTEPETTHGPGTAYGPETAETEVTITNEHGLHLRAAARLVNLTGAAACSVELGVGDTFVDGKSLLGITSLLARKGAVLRARATGPGAAELVLRVEALVRGGFA